MIERMGEHQFYRKVENNDLGIVRNLEYSLFNSLVNVGDSARVVSLISRIFPKVFDGVEIGGIMCW